MSRKIIDVAVIGVGNIGFHHARNYSQISNAKLVAVSDIDEVRGQAVAEKFGCKFYSDYKVMLKEESIDAISLCLPISLHHVVGMELIHAGKHVLIEKPLAATTKQACELDAAAKSKGMLLTVGHIERFNPAVQELKRRIDAGELGNITSIVTKRVGGMPPQVRDANVIIDLAVHDIDILNYLLGQSPTEVHAAAGKALLADRADHAELFLKYGVVGCFIQVNWITPIVIRSLSITGDKGYAELNYVTQKLAIYQTNYENSFNDFGEFVIRFGKASAINAEIVQREPLRGELETFVDAVATRSPLIVSGNDGIEAVRIAEMALSQIG